MVNLLSLGRCVLTATDYHGYLHLTNNEKSSGHVTGPFIYSSKSAQKKRQNRKTVDARKVLIEQYLTCIGNPGYQCRLCTESRIPKAPCSKT